MRYHTRFLGDKKQKVVYTNLRFPVKTTFPDSDEIWDVGLVPNASEPNADADLKERVESTDLLDEFILREGDLE